MRTRIVLVAGCLAAAVCLLLLWSTFWRDARAAKGAIDWHDVDAGREWLGDLSTWSQSIDVSRERPPQSELGSFTIGNGRVFTMLGLMLPASTLHNTLGPTYQKQTGFLGYDIIGLRIDGKDVACPVQTVQRVRRSGVVRTTMRGDGCALETLDFAPPELDAIVRVVRIRNLSDRGFRAEAVVHLQSLVVGSPGPPALLRRGRLRVLAGAVGDGARVRSAYAKVGLDGSITGHVDAGAGVIVTIPFGKLAPKQGRAKIHYLVISDNASAEGETLRALQDGGLDALDQTRAWWQEWHEGATTLRCPEPRVTDLLDDAKAVIKTQQAAAGGYSPMHLYSSCWVRDSNGPIRYMLRCGKFEDVRRALDYYYEASARRQGIWMNHPLDLPLAGDTPKVNWRRLPMEPAEVPSFVVLQHHWYYRYTGDLAPIEAHWDYLKRNVEGQELSPDDRLPFHGDETYRFPGYAIWNASRTEPTDYLELDHLFSADSAFEYVAAAEAMSEMAAALGRRRAAQHFQALAERVRGVTERVYWQPQTGFYAPASSRFSGRVYRYPLANIDLRPLWVGYSDPESPRAQQNVVSALSHLWRDDGTADMTPGFGYTTGMTPGMVLYSLAAIDHAAAETALRGVIGAFSPAAGIAEMLEPDNRPSGGIWGERRARPWEGGINAEAVLYYLTGLEPDAPHMRARLCPRVPFGWQSMSIDNMRLADNRLSVSVRREPTQTSYSVTNDGAREAHVELVVSLPQCAINAITVRDQPLRPEHAPVTQFGRTRQRVDLALPAGGDAEVVLDHGPPVATEAGKIQRRAFRYPGPDIGRAKTVVVTLRPETAGKWRKRDPNAFIIDSFIAFPPSYLRAALLTPDSRGRRVDTLVLDVDDWAGAFKRPNFWEKGAGSKITRRFEELGGHVVRQEPPPDAQAKRLPVYPGQPFEQEVEEDDDG